MLIGLNDKWNPVGDKPTATVHGSVRTKVINGYTLIFQGLDDDNNIWKMVKGEFIKQVDGHNCGPIACVNIEQFSLMTAYKVKIVYDLNSIWVVVTNE